MDGISLTKITFLVISINSLMFPFILNYEFHIKNPANDLKTYHEFQYSEDEIIDFVYSNKTVADELYYEILKGYLHFPLEFSTDNFTEANNFIEKYYPDYYENITETSENEKFFDFISKSYHTHPILGNYTTTEVIRVHKMSYIFLNKSDYLIGLPELLQLNQSESFKIGIFNQHPINSSNTKEVSSYIWFLRSWMIYGLKIANYALSEDNNTVYCMFLETNVVHGDWGIYDMITLVYSKFSINKNNGSISIWSKAFDEFKGKYNPPHGWINDDPFSQLRQIIVIVLVILLPFSILIYFLQKYYRERKIS